MSSEGLIDFFAGWCSGGAAVLLCQPTDTILTRYQAGITLQRHYVPTSVSHTYKSLIQQFGIRSLWRGSSAMIGAVPFQNALLMSGYGLGKRWGEQEEAQSNPYVGVFVGGCTGGIVQSFLMSPVELIKVEQQVINKRLMQATHHVGTNLLSTTAATTAATTSSGWRGLNATLLRDGIPHGVWFVSYEMCKDYLSEQIGGTPQHDGVTVPLVSGAVAATVAWAVGYPADLIKTRIQASPEHKGLYRTAMELRQEPGGLYRGFGLKLVRAVPASMIGFVTYEYVKGVLEQ